MKPAVILWFLIGRNGQTMGKTARVVASVFGMIILISVGVVTYYSIDRERSFNDVRKICESIPAGTEGGKIEEYFKDLPEARIKTSNDELVIIQSSWVMCWVRMKSGRSLGKYEVLYSD